VNGGITAPSVNAGRLVQVVTRPQVEGEAIADLMLLPCEQLLKVRSLPRLGGQVDYAACLWTSASAGVRERGGRSASDSGAPGPAHGRCEAGLSARAPSCRGVRCLYAGLGGLRGEDGQPPPPQAIQARGAGAIQARGAGAAAGPLVAASGLKSGIILPHVQAARGPPG